MGNWLIFGLQFVGLRPSCLGRSQASRVFSRVVKETRAFISGTILESQLRSRNFRQDQGAEDGGTFQRERVLKRHQ